MKENPAVNDEPTAETSGVSPYDLAGRIEAARAAEAAEQHRQETARRASSAKAIAARALGLKEREVERVQPWGPRLVATVRGTRFVIAGPEAPDAAGRFGALPADKDLPGKAKFAPLPDEPVPPPEPERRVRWPKPRRPKPPPEPTAAEVAARAAAVADRDRRLLEIRREQLAEVDERLSRGEAEHGHGDLVARRAAMAAEVSHLEGRLRAYELELNPPPPEAWLVAKNLAVARWAKVLLAGGSLAEAVEAADNAAVSTFKPWFPQRELDGAEQWLRHHGFAGDGEEES